MNARSVAIKAGADGLSPTPYVKNVLSQNFAALPNSIDSSSTLFCADISRALLHESLLYLLRAMSHIICYEAIYSKNQFSWALVTLYYSNYFCALSMNRLAGKAISTTNGKNFEIVSSQIQSNFEVKRIKVNNHKLVWDTNYDLYSNFNWKDIFYDGVIIKVINRDHYERKSRESINYHPDSYKEIFKTKSQQNNIASFFGKNYIDSPPNIALLPFTDDIERMIANLECRAIARQIILLTIFNEVSKILQPTSKAVLREYFRNFSNNVMNHSPFNSKLKSTFQPLINNLII